MIIGGSSGIGLSICGKLIAMGDAVTCVSTSACPTASVKSIIADVTDDEKLQSIFSEISELDVLIYCAGISLAAPTEYVERADMKRLIDVNLVGAIDCCRLALPLLKKSDAGRIMLLSSTGGVTPIAYDSFYSASKAGLIMFSKALAVELPENVKCTAAIIGGVRTRFSFKRKIYDCDGTEYETDLKNAADALIKIEQSGYSPDTVADKIIDIIGGTPPPVVSIGLSKKMMTAASKLMPDRLMYWVTNRIYNLGPRG